MSKEAICEKVKDLCKNEKTDFLFIVEGKSCWSISRDEHIRKVAKFHKENEPKTQKENICDNNNCNLITCRYNQSGTCTNEGKRKECVEVSKKALCLEGRENVNECSN